MKKLIRMMREEQKIADKLTQYRKKCKCGHTMYLIDNPYKICSHCGSPVFRDEKAKFIYKVGGMKCLH